MSILRIGDFIQPTLKKINFLASLAASFRTCDQAVPMDVSKSKVHLF